MADIEVKIVSTHRIFSIIYDDSKGREIEAEVLEEDDDELSIWDFRVLDVKIDGVVDYDSEIDEDEIIEKLQEHLDKQG